MRERRLMRFVFQKKRNRDVEKLIEVADQKNDAQRHVNGNKDKLSGRGNGLGTFYHGNWRKIAERKLNLIRGIIRTFRRKRQSYLTDREARFSGGNAEAFAKKIKTTKKRENY